MNSYNEVKKIVREFEKQKIEYAILRNYTQLINGKYFEFGDIDALVRSSDVNKIQKILFDNKYIKEKIFPGSKHEGYSKYIAEDRKLVSFHFHINGVTGKHITYLDGKTLLKRKLKYKDFWTISKEDLFLLLVFHSLLDKSRFMNKYKKDLIEVSKENLDFEYIDAMLAKQVGKHIAKQIINQIVSDRFNETELLRKKARLNFIARSPFEFSKVMFFGAIWKLSQLIFTKAPLICFLGMDGSGKTTITNEIIKILNENKIRNKLIYTGRGKLNILPIQKVGLAYKKKEETIFKKPSARKTILYTLASPVFAFDLFLRYWAQIWPARKKRNIVIADRYATDLLLMANVPFWIRKCLYSLFPKPTMIIYLYNTPEVLHKRKLSHPIEDLKRQEQIFSQILPKLKPKPITIKSETVEKTLNQVAEKVVKRLYP